jgi:hypothetical protein
MHGVYKKIIQRYLNDLKKIQEPSNIWEDELPSDSIKKNMKCSCNSIGKIQETQKNHHGDSTKELISCCDSNFHSPPRSSMDFQDTARGGNQRRS